MKSPSTLVHGLSIIKTCVLYQFKKVLFLIFLFASSSPIYSQLAFPTAVGSAAYASGGRGGSVSIVTNTNDSGLGSLRSFQNVSNTTIVFNVSGVINLSSALFLYGNNVTIAGQTSPEGGITIEGATVIFQNNSNLICRYIRFRGGYHQGDTNDSVGGFGLIDVIFDHCSISFGGDEAISLLVDTVADRGGAITVQNCLIAESKTGSIMGGEGAPDNYGTLSMIGNVWYNITHRFPNLVGNSRFDIINNYVHNCKWRLINTRHGLKLNQINNLYDYGNLLESKIYDPRMNMHTCVAGFNIPTIYTNGNILLGIQGNGSVNQPVTSTIAQVEADNTLSWKYFYTGSDCGTGFKRVGDQLEPQFFTNTQFPLLGNVPTIYKATSLKSLIVPNSGTSKRLNDDGSVSDNNDVLDAEWKKNIKEGNYTLKLDQSQYSTPAITSITRKTSYDSDNDGMPDVWELSTFNTLNHSGRTDSNGNGYTDLEEFLNQIDASDVVNIALQGIEISPSTAQLQVTENLQLTTTFTPANATNKNGVWKSSNETIATVDANGLVVPVSSGVVTITFTSSEGNFTDTSEITVFPEAFQANAGNDQQICEGTGTTLTATGGGSYLWSTGATTATISVEPTETTTYNVTVFDATGANSESDDVTVTVSPVPNVNAGEDVTITVGNDVTLTASGADTYLWNTGATTANITVSPLQIKTYTVVGTSNGCEATDSVTVLLIDNIVNANAGEDQIICKGSAATLTAAGGSSYVWNTGAITSSITVTPNNTTNYTVTAYGILGLNSSTDDVKVTVKAAPIVNAGNDVIIDFGESTTLSASGADNYKWNTGETSQSIIVSPNATKTYTVTGTSNDCEATDSVTVFLTGSNVTANAGQDVAVCKGNSTILTASGGATYKWNNGAITASITVNPNATTTYTVTAFDESGIHSDTDDVTVTVSPLPIANAGTDVSICRGNSVTLSANGGGIYLWNTGATTQSISVHPNNTKTYSVEVSKNGCEDSDEVTVTVNPLPTVYAGDNQTMVNGQSVSLTASGATSYQWNTGETSRTISVRPNVTTIYTVTGTSNGCEATDSVTVFLTGSNVTANAGHDVSVCEGNSIKLTASGGASYQWSSGANTASITVNPSTTTTYTVTAFDSSGINSDKDEVKVTVNPLPIANAGTDVSTCRGTSVTLTATGGESYLWNTGATTASISVNPNSTKIYSVEVSENGCTDIDDVKVNVIPLPTVSGGADVTINYGESVTLRANGGSSYKWSNGETTQNITVSPNATKTYSVSATSNGCEGTDSVTVFVNSNTAVAASAGQDKSTCLGDSVTLTASGGDRYLWSTGEATQSITVNPNNTSTFSVIVYKGIVHAEDEVTVFVNPSPVVSVLNGEAVTILQGEYVTLSARGANTYRWNNGATQPNIAVNPDGTTTYSVTGYINDCFDLKDVVVNVVPKVVAYAGQDQIVCLNEIATLTATGGDEFLWNTGETTQSINVTPSSDTEYSVMVYNELDYDTANVMVFVNGCSASQIPDEPEGFEFLVFPNPTSGNLNIKISGLLDVSNIYIFDLTGKVLYQETMSTGDLQMFEKTLDISNYPDGLYLLKLVDERNTVTKKIILNRQL